MANKKVDEKIDETIVEMKNKIEEISKNADSIDGELSVKAKEVKEKSTEVLNKAIAKLKLLYNEAKDPEEIAKTIDFVKAKSRDLAYGANKTINGLKQNESFKKTVDDVGDIARNVGNMANDAYQELKLNEQFQEVSEKVVDGYNNVKKGVQEILAKPEVKEGIEKAKDVTIDVAQKAVDALRDWLKPEDKEQ